MINKNKPFYSNKLFQIPLIFLLIVFMYMPKTFSGFIVSNHCTWDLDHIIEFDVADTICADGQINTYYGFPNFQYFADVFIVPNRVWSHNDILIDITSDNRVIGDLGGGSFLGATIGLPGGTPRGEYDLILDDNANGRFDLGYDSIIGQGTDFAFRVVESGRPIPDVSGIKTRAAGLETSYGAAATAWPLYLDLLDLQSQASAFASGPIGIMEYYLWKPYNDMTGDFARKIMGSYGPNPTPPPQRLAFGILGNAAKKWGDLARDPADPVFDEFVALDLQGIASETVGFGAPYTYPFAPIGPSQREADMVAWGNLGVQQVALVKALQRTIEKYQGADQAFDDTYAYLQVRQLKEYANMLKVNMTGSILSANQIKANIIAEGDDDVLDVSALASFQQRVINSGLTPEEEGNILALGFDAADIIEAELRIEGWDLPANDGGISERLDDLVTDMTAAVTTMQDLATTSQSLMDYLAPSITIVHPTADAGGPYSGNEGSPIAFSGAGSSDPTLQMLTYEWDFNNNGVFGEVPDDRVGSVVTYQWDYEYTGVVGLKVTDPDGNYDIDYADVTTLTANSEPVIDSLTPASISPTASVYDPLGFSITASDPDSDPLTYTWLLDGVVQSLLQNWTYSPLATDSGYKVVTAKVSDGNSLSRDAFETRKVLVYSDADLDTFTSDADCDDSDAAINPNAIEVCDGVDNDCDGQIDEGVSITYYADLDSDGFGDPNNTVEGCALPPSGSVADNTDCDDSDGTIYPGAAEVCDGIDNDCDGTVDDDLTFDVDGDGHSSPASCAGTQDDCDDSDASVYPGAPEICDGQDNDCDSIVDEGVTDDADGDGFDVCDGDCDDNDNTVFPGAAEVCDRADNDCDTVVPANEIDNDGDGFAVCEGDCNDGNAAINPVAAEICDNMDNDCDGFIDEGFDQDGDGFTVCNGDCDDTDPNVNPATAEVLYNLINDDCDGGTLDYIDNDGDGYFTVQNANYPSLVDCDDSNSNINPGVEEVVGNGIDDDCSSATLDTLADTFIIAVDYSSRLYYAASNGDGTWSGYREVDRLSGNTGGAAIADYDNDGDLDFVAGSPSGHTVTFYLYQNDGSDNFTRIKLGTGSNANSYQMDMTAGDFNNDGNMDFLGNSNWQYLHQAMGDGTGNFTITTVDLGVGNGRGLDAADFNHDGHLDYIRTVWSSGQITLYTGNGDGTFTNSGVVGDPGGDPYGLTAADFNNDGHVDILANEGGSGNPYLYTGNGDGTFAAGVYVASVDANNHGGYDAYDFNNDGNVDVVLTNYTGRQLWFYPGNGDGTFGTRLQINTSNTLSNTMGISAPPYSHVFGSPYAVIKPAEQTIPLANAANLDGSDSNDNDDGGSLVSWDWDFGDSTTGTGQTVSHTYASEGAYNVTLKVIDNDGKITYGNGKVNVIGTLPVADAGGPYIFGESFAQDGVFTVSLDGSGSTDDSSIVKYEWDYVFEDDFAGTLLASGKWIASIGVTQNEKIFIAGTTGSWTNRYLFSKEDFKREAGLIFQTKVLPSNTSGNQHAMIGFKDTAVDYNYTRMPHAIYFNNGNLQIYEDGSDRGVFGTYGREEEYEIKIALKTQGAQYYYRPVVNTIWATGATASSQYSTGSWSAMQAAGVPNVTACGDNASAWTTAGSDMGEQWLELTYTNPVTANKIRVHETYNSGFITKIDFYDASDIPTTVWSGTDSTPCPGWFEADVNPAFSTQKVRIYVDTNVPGWNEIDAVGLVSTVTPDWALLYDSNYSSTTSMKVGGTFYSGIFELDDVQVSPLVQEGVNPTRILYNGTHTVTLTVTDTVGQQDSETTTINTVFNNPPIADAGGPYSVDESAASEGGWSVTLDGSGSTDDVEINRYIWDFGVDSFDGTTLDIGKWYTNGGLSRNDLISLTGASTWNTRYMVSKDLFPKSKGQTFQTKIMVGGGGQCMFGFKNNNTTNFHYNQFPYEIYLSNGSIYIYENSNSRGYTGFNFAYNTWYDYRIELKDTGAVYSYRQSGDTDWIVVYNSNYTTGDTDLRKGIVAHSNTWNIDDFVETTVGVNPTCRFYGTGSHAIDLTVYDRVNQSHTDSTTVQVNPGNPPVADSGPDITVDETGAVDGTWTVDFDATGSTDDNGIFLYEWDWNYDGSTFNPSGDTGATPNHTFSGTGTYTVAVRVTDNALQTHIDAIEVTITQGNPPSANTGGPYSVDESTGNAFEGGWTVTLDGSGSSDNETSIAKYVWDLGTDTFDGTEINDGKWAHSSNVTQNNELSVPVTSNGWGINYFFSKDTYTRAKGMTFEAKVKHSSSSVMVGFKNTNTTYHYNQMTYAIYFAGTNIYIYEDGANRGDTGKDAPYNTWYDVRIELKENAGAKYYYRVSGNPDWILLYDSSYSSAASLKRGADVNSGTFVMDDLKEIAAGVNPTYRFYGQGKHPISLTVWDQAYQTDTNSSNVTTITNNAPVADAGPDRSGNETDAFEGTWTFDFDATNSSDDYGIYTYEWDWNYDGSNFVPSGDTAATLSHTFSGSGTYTVALRLTDHALQPTIDTATVTLTTGAPPVAVAGDDITTEGHWPVSFNGGNSTDDLGIAIYHWDFGDGTTGTGKTPTHIYWNQGDYTVTLTVYDNALQSSSDTLLVHSITGNVPVADAGGPYDAGAGNPPAYFNGSSSTDDYGVVKYLWDVDATVDSDGDGNLTNDMDVVGRKPFYTYSTAGTYTATLAVVDGAGQTDTATATVNVAGNLPPDVICVPWVGTDPLSRHETFSGRSIKLKAIVRDAGSLTYQWDFGDGSAPFPATPAAVDDIYTIEASHAYVGSDGALFSATLRVWDSNGIEGSDQYHVIIKPDDYETGTNIAIDEGLWYLHKTQNRSNGSWTYGSYTESPTGSSIQAFEINGHLQDGDNQENPYVETVNKGFVHLFDSTSLRSVTINNAGYMTHGNPDTNGNGIGIEVIGQPIYQGGMVMDAIASSNTPLAFATTGGADIKGRFFYEILTDMVDMYSYGQVESGGDRGGWRYGWHGGSDNSACQWAAIGFTAAEDNFGINVPQFVKDENNVWLNTSYNGSGFGYTTGGNSAAGVPSGMVQLTFDDKRTSDPRWQTAEAYIANNWGTWSGNHYYAMYAMVKALRLAQPEPVVTFKSTGFDWYNDPNSGIRKRLVDAQILSGGNYGGWLGSGHARGYNFHTPWAIIMLTPTLFVQPPVADAGDDIIWAYDEELTFDASGTFHKDPIRSIVKYEWDFDGDGTWDLVTNNPSDPAAKFTYPDPNPDQGGDAPQVFLARLRVTDNNDPAQTDIDTRKVTAAEPPHAPFAVIGGPYTVTAGIPFTLDGSGSFDIDPGDSIASYQWDLDNDGVFFDDVDIDTTNSTESYTYQNNGVYIIGLKVTDNGGFNPIGCTIGVDCIPLESLESFTTVTVVSNQPPVADAGGPYVVDEGTAVTLDGSGSSDPNGDTLTYSWDLNNDGAYDDATGVKPSYTFADNGAYTIGLKVSDSLLSDTATATVTVNDLSPTAAFTWNPEPQDEGSSVSFTDQSVSSPDTIVSWAWDFAGLGGSNVQNPGFTFPDNGSYAVSLTVTDNDGSSNTVIQAVTIVNVSPTVNAGPDQTVTEDDTVNFAGSFTDPGTNDTHTISWDFGDGNSAFGNMNQSHVYADPGTYTVTLTVTDDDTGVGSDTLTMTVELGNEPPVAEAGGPYTGNEGSAILLDGTGSTDPDGDALTYAWDLDNDGVYDDSTSVTPSVSYPDQGAYTVGLQVSDGNVVSTDTATVTVNDLEPIAALTGDITVDLGAVGNYDASASTSSPDTIVSYEWDWDYDGTTFNASPDTGVAQNHTWSTVGPYSVAVMVTDDDGSFDIATLEVTVVDNEPPVIVCPVDISVGNDAGNCDAIVNYVLPVGSDNSGSVAVTQTGGLASGSTFPLGTSTVTYQATDPSGNSASCSFTITVNDNEPPVALAQDITTQLDSAGNTSITAAQVDNGSNDNCGVASLSVSPDSFDCANVGANTVILTVTDINGNTSTATATVTVEDNVAPVALALDITVQLDATGNTSITAGQVDNGSSDNCGVASLSVAPDSFDCANVGANTVILTVTDINGNTSAATLTVTVEDNVAPVALAQDITAQLDANGNTSITFGDVDAGSSDNCGIASLSVAPSSFNCANVGNNTVTLTVTDVNGNVSTETAVVTVVDTVAPTAVTQSITVQLDATGSASITATQIDNGSSDNCGIASLSVSPASFNCVNVGANTVTLTVTDTNGNVSTADAVVTVEDNVAPVALTNDITVQLDVNGNVSITANQVDNGSNDACGIASLSVAPSDFNCANVGANTVTLTVTDNNGNVSTATAVVTVQDSVPPVVLTQNMTVQLDANGNVAIPADGSGVDAGSNDACGVASTSVLPNSFSCSDVGVNAVTLTVTDVNGNVNTGLAMVTVVDVVAPTAAAQDITVQLDATGNVSITSGDIDASSSDNCGIASLSISQTDFNCDNVGENTVTLTVTDNNNNVSTATAIVTVEDNVAPVASAQDITVELGENGDVTITASQVDNGSSDACGIESLSVAPESFDCSHVGDNTVTLTVIDNNGNVSTTTAVVTVENNLVPVVLTQILTVQLDVDGNAMILADGSEIDAGSSDTCGIDFMAVEPTVFTCSNIGDNTVTLTVINVNGNSSSAPATVTVEDSIMPEIEIPVDVTVECTGDTSSAATGVATGTDTCGTVTITESDSSVPGIGDTEVITRTWTATDESGNSISGDQIITVVDTTFPELEVPIDVTVECTGDTSSVATGVATGSDTCGTVTITESDSSVAGPGNTEVITRTWTVTDESGNSVSADQTITVVDTTVPELTVPAYVTVECAGDTSSVATGLATGSDTCGIVTITESDSSVAGPGNTEVITRTWTATDENGNATSADQIITVVDTTVPELTLPADTTVECTEDTNSIATGVATGTDTCGSVAITESDTSVPGCGNTSVVSRTWKATDDNGNSTTGVQTITVVDTTSPTVTAALVPVKVKKKHGCFRVEFSAADSCGDVPGLTAVLNGHPVTNGELVKLHKKKKYRVKVEDGSSDGRSDDKGSGHRKGHGSDDDSRSDDCGTVKFEGPDFTLTVTATDDCGNEGIGTGTHVFEGGSNDDDSRSDDKSHDDEGVGNGVDGNTPGHAHNGGNDDEGFGPGNPGAKHKNSDDDSGEKKGKNGLKKSGNGSDDDSGSGHKEKSKKNGKKKK